MAKQVGCDADLLGRAVDQLGHGAVPEEVRPDRLPESLPGAQLDLLPDRPAAPGPATTVQPEVPAGTGLALPP